jgi:hypothetical protein
VDDKGLALLKGLPELRELSLDSANVGDAVIDTLVSLPRLEVLNLYHTLITETGVQRIKSSLPKCKVIWDENSALPNRRRT